jgi:Kef-type K+ transport system membrane component KefB
MSPVLPLLLLIIIIIVAAKAAGSLVSRFGLPAVLGELSAGLILGPTFLNILNWPVFQSHGGHHPPPGEVINLLAEIGVILLMFVAGMETDLDELKRVGKVAFSAAIGGVLFPGVGGALVAYGFGYPLWHSVFIGTVLTATSVSITAQTLMELGALRSKEGSTILGAAVIDDVLGILVLSIVVAFAAGAAAGHGGGEANGLGAGAVLRIVLHMIGFFIIGWILGRKTFEWLAEKLARLPVSQPLFAFVIVTAFVYAFAAEYLGKVAAITGSYMAGVLFAQTRFKQRIDEAIHPITYTIWVPIFFINIGLQANGRQLDRTLLFFTLVIIVVAVLGKVVGCAAFSWMVGFNTMEGVRVGTGMISRGEVGLIVTQVGLSMAIIGRELFSVMVIMVLVTTLVTPLLLRLVFPRRPPRPDRPDVYESISHLELEEQEEGKG